MNHTFNHNPHADELTPSPELLNKIMVGISNERQQMRWRRRLTLYSMLSVVAVLLIIPAWQYFQVQALQTGFSEYIHLAFVDYSLAALYWQEFSLSLLESLPALSLAALLGSLVIALFGLTRIARYRKLITQTNN